MKFRILTYALIACLLKCSFEITNNKFLSKDPFEFLGIPSLNPSKFLEDLDKKLENNNEKSMSIYEQKKRIPKLQTVDDLPNFLKHSNLDEDIALSILTKFLISDDIKLKKYGCVYDQSGFDGLNPVETISAEGTEERLKQRARSAANLFYKEMHKDSNYDAYGSDEDNSEVIKDWKLYKVLLIGNEGESLFIKVCLPIDENEPALCSLNLNEKCENRIEYVNKQKKANEDYLAKIKNGNFFKRKINNNKNYEETKKLSSENIKDNALFNLLEKNNNVASFNFKEIEFIPNNTQNITTNSSFLKNDNIEPKGIMAEIKEMKEQINMLINNIKQKDVLIEEQKKKLEESSDSKAREELNQMKEQIKQLMEVSKERDKIINEQKEKLSKI